MFDCFTRSYRVMREKSVCAFLFRTQNVIWGTLEHSQPLEARVLQALPLGDATVTKGNNIVKCLLRVFGCIFLDAQSPWFQALSSLNIRYLALEVPHPNLVSVKLAVTLC